MTHTYSPAPDDAQHGHHPAVESPAASQLPPAAAHASPTLLGTARGRGNAESRAAAVQRMQQITGNRATRLAVQRRITAGATPVQTLPAPAATAVQREDDSPAVDQERQAEPTIAERIEALRAKASQPKGFFGFFTNAPRPRYHEQLSILIAIQQADPADIEEKKRLEEQFRSIEEEDKKRLEEYQKRSKGSTSRR